jgi:hypothetical protein
VLKKDIHERQREQKSTNLMKKAFEVINQMMADGIIDDYAIGGAIGASFYIEAGATEDIDTFVHITPSPPMFAELSEIYSYLVNKGYFPKDEFIVIEDWDVQFLVPAEDSIETEAVKHANIIKFHDQEIRVMMPEYLAAIALNTQRDKDIDRVRAFIKQDRVSVEDLEVLVRRFKLEDQWQRVKRLL